MDVKPFKVPQLSSLRLRSSRHPKFPLGKPTSLCNFDCTNSLEPVNHRNKPKKVLLYTCRKCNFKTNSLLVLFKHASDLCKMARWFKCDQCAFKTGNHRYLYRHKRYKHTPLENIQWFKCERCQYKTKWKGNLKAHVESRHTDKQQILLTCKDCSFTTKWKKCLKMHITRKHVVDTIPKVINCKLCSFQTTRSDSLKRHVLAIHTHDEECYKFECNLCKFKTKRSDHLKRHKVEQHCVKKIKNVCNRSKLNTAVPIVVISDSDDDVNLIPSNGTQETWYSCRQCPYSTNMKRSLKIHNLNHARNEANGTNMLIFYPCPFCDLRTIRKDSLKRHIREKHMKWSIKHQAAIKPPEPPVVTQPQFRQIRPKVAEKAKKAPVDVTSCVPQNNPQEKWYICDQCPFSSQMPMSLKIHKLSHNSQSNNVCFQCRLCSVRTLSRESLSKHIVERHGVQVQTVRPQLICGQCPYVTEWMNSLNRHILSKHQNNNIIFNFTV